jgi:hypothetical protein
MGDAAFLAYLRVVGLLLYEKTEQKLRTISFKVQDYAAEIRTVHILYTGCHFNLQLESRGKPAFTAVSSDRCPAQGCDSRNALCMSHFVMVLGLFDYEFLKILICVTELIKGNGFLCCDCVQLEGPVSYIFRVEGSRSVFGNKIQEDWRGISYTY